MTKKELSHIICPYCNSQFYLNKCYTKKQKNIIFGTVYCNCDEFPIIDSILYLHKNKTKAIINSLSQHEFHNATAIALDLDHIKTFLYNIFTQYNKNFAVSPDNFINRRLISLIFKIPPNQFKYYFFRHLEIESLLFFLPLSFKKIENSSLWLDVGSGITNYYHYLHQIYPKLNIISLEMFFSNIYLSHLFFPQKNITYICSDFSYGLHLHPKTIDVITFIDSLPFIKKQKYSLNLATSLLKTTGLLYVSSMVEHLYINDFANVFPLSSQLIRNFLSTPCQIFDEEKLCQKIFEKNSLEQSLLTPFSSPKFRYSLLWPTQKLLNKITIPPFLTKNKHTQWLNPTIQWHNRVY